MGHFNPASDSQIVQSLVDIFPKGYPESFWTAPVVFQNVVYFGPNTTGRDRRRVRVPARL